MQFKMMEKRKKTVVMRDISGRNPRKKKKKMINISNNMTTLSLLQKLKTQPLRLKQKVKQKKEKREVVVKKPKKKSKCEPSLMMKVDENINSQQRYVEPQKKLKTSNDPSMLVDALKSSVHNDNRESATMPTPVRHASSARKHILTGKRCEKEGDFAAAMVHFERTLQRTELVKAGKGEIAVTASARIRSKLLKLKKKLSKKEGLEDAEGELEVGSEKELGLKTKVETSNAEAKFNLLNLVQEGENPLNLEERSGELDSICVSTEKSEVSDAVEVDLSDDRFTKSFETKEDDGFNCIPELNESLLSRQRESSVKVARHQEMSDPLFDCFDEGRQCLNDSPQERRSISNDNALLDTPGSCGNGDMSFDSCHFRVHSGLCVYNGVETCSPKSFRDESPSFESDKKVTAEPPRPHFSRRWRTRTKLSAKTDDALFSADSCPTPISAEIFDLVTSRSNWRNGPKVNEGWTKGTIEAWHLLQPVFDSIIDVEGTALLSTIDAEAASGVSPVAGTVRSRLSFSSFDLSNVDMPSARLSGSFECLSCIVSFILKCQKEARTVLETADNKAIDRADIDTILDMFSTELRELHNKPIVGKGKISGQATRRRIYQWARVSGLSSRRSEQQRQLQRKTKVQERIQAAAGQYFAQIFNNLRAWYKQPECNDCINRKEEDDWDILEAGDTMEKIDMTSDKPQSAPTDCSIPNYALSFPSLPFDNRLAQFLSSSFRYSLRASLNCGESAGSTTAVDASKGGNVEGKKGGMRIIANTGNSEHNLEDLAAVLHHALSTIHRTSDLSQEKMVSSLVKRVELSILSATAAAGERAVGIVCKEEKEAQLNRLAKLKAVNTTRIGAVKFLTQLLDDNVLFHDASVGKGAWSEVRRIGFLIQDEISLHWKNPSFVDILEPFCPLVDVPSFLSYLQLEKTRLQEVKKELQKINDQIMKGCPSKRTKRKSRKIGVSKRSRAASKKKDLLVQIEVCNRLKLPNLATSFPRVQSV
eukprot:g2898.t1